MILNVSILCIFTFLKTTTCLAESWIRSICRCVYRASYCNVLITNEMHNSHNQFLFHSFCLFCMFRTNLVVHHQEHGIIYCITQYNWYNRYNRAGESRHACTIVPIVLCVQYSILCRAPDDERLDSFETCRTDKNFGIKIDYKNCASRWSLTH